MIIDIDCLFENSFVVSIDTNRYDRFCTLFEKANLNRKTPEKFIGFQVANGVYSESGFIKMNNICNCAFSHIALVKYAQLHNLDFICVFEDDAVPCIDCKQLLTKQLQHIPNDADLLKLGHLGNIESPIKFNDYFEIPTLSFGSHAYIIFKQYYSKFIENAYKDMHIDRLAMNVKGGDKIYQSIDMTFVQYNVIGEKTIHDNKAYIDLLAKQHKLDNFKLS